MFAISNADRVFLACGAAFGFCLVFYISHSFLASLFLGVAPGVGGNCVVLIIAKLVWPDGIERLNFFRLSRGRRYWQVTVLSLLVVCAYWQPLRNHNSFALAITTLFVLEFAVLFGYFWYRDERSAH